MCFYAKRNVDSLYKSTLKTRLFDKIKNYCEVVTCDHESRFSEQFFRSASDDKFRKYWTYTATPFLNSTFLAFAHFTLVLNRIVVAKRYEKHACRFENSETTDNTRNEIRYEDYFPSILRKCIHERAPQGPPLGSCVYVIIWGFF